MKWIGLTGSIGCGKSTVCQFLKERSIPIVDADEIAKKVVEIASPGLRSIQKEFGAEFLCEDGSLDRRKLGQFIFGDTKKKEKLEFILHPLIRQETLHQRKVLADRHEPLAIYDIPLLFETKAQDQFDAIVVVSCTEQQQKERLLQRNPQWTMEEIESRIASQIPIHIKEEAADFVVHNDGDRAHLENEMESLMLWLKKLQACSRI